MGGAAAWENADSLEEACQKEGCNNRRIVYACFNIEISFEFLKCEMIVTNLFLSFFDLRK